MATNRQRAERDKLTTKEYFWYAQKPWYADKYNFRLSEVMCDDCSYIPRSDSADPKRAFKAHVKKYHRFTWEQKFGQPFVIAEEDDSGVDVDAFLRELLDA